MRGFTHNFSFVRFVETSTACFGRFSETMSPAPSLYWGLSQRPSLMSARKAPRPYPGRIFAPNARAGDPGRGAFVGGQLASDDAKRVSRLRIFSASAAASSSSFFPSPMDGNKVQRVRESRLRGRAREKES